MKLTFSNQRKQGLTILEVLVVILVLCVLIAVVLPPVSTVSKTRAQNINCINNIKQISFAQRSWEGDVETNHSVAPWSNFTSAVDWFRSMSNQLVTPKILICPADYIHWPPATNFQNDFNSSHISYFINPDATETYPQSILFGDDNLALNGVPIKSGFNELPTNAVISWLPNRHGNGGNIAYADGSVGQISSSGLQQALEITGLATNRLAIP